MKKFLKKLTYLGVDLTAQTIDNIQDTIKELVEKGEISEKKGEKIINKLIQKTELKKDYLERKIKKILNKSKKGISDLLDNDDIKDTLNL